MKVLPTLSCKELVKKRKVKHRRVFCVADEYVSL